MRVAGAYTYPSSKAEPNRNPGPFLYLIFIRIRKDAGASVQFRAFPIDMKISDRFTNYGLIGGFFWILQVALVSTFGTERHVLAVLLHTLETMLKDFPSSAFSSLAALLGAVSLIAIFTTGLLLDLLGSFFYRGDELYVFLRHMQVNELWLRKLIESHKDYIQNDWSALLDTPPLWPFMKKVYKNAFLSEFMFWSRRVREERTQIKVMRAKILVARQAYLRMQSFLLSYVLLVSGSENEEFLSTQISLWTMSRAISTAMSLAVLEAFIMFMFSLGTRSISSFLFGLLMTFGVVIVGALAGIASAVTRSAHGRVCSTLFSLAYVTSKKTLV